MSIRLTTNDLSLISIANGLTDLAVSSCCLVRPVTENAKQKKWVFHVRRVRGCEYSIANHQHTAHLAAVKSPANNSDTLLANHKSSTADQSRRLSHLLQ